MTSSVDLRFWDSCCFTALIAGEDGRVDHCRNLLNDAKAGKFTAVTSTLTLAEITRHNNLLAFQFRSTIDSFFLNPYIEVRPIDRFVGEGARDLCWNYNLRPADAAQLAAALRRTCQTFYTYDDQILRLNGRVPNIQIIPPAWEGQLSLIE